PTATPWAPGAPSSGSSGPDAISGGERVKLTRSRAPRPRTRRDRTGAPRHRPGSQGRGDAPGPGPVPAPGPRAMIQSTPRRVGRMLTPEQIASYREHGYLVVEGVVDPGRLAVLRRVVDELVERARGLTDHTDVYDLDESYASGAP